jgi:hypothetical protein
MEENMQGSSLELPTGYYLERDPDTLILHRLDGTMVGAFSTRGAAPAAVRQTAEETVRGESSAQSRKASSSGAVPPSLQARFFSLFEMLCDEEPITLDHNGKE